MSAGFFEEDNGSKSSMRLMSIIALVAAIVFGSITITKNTNSRNDTEIYITFGFLIAAFAPKALQKFAESKLPSYIYSPQTLATELPIINSLNPQAQIGPSSTNSQQANLNRLQMRGR